jgi:hypothetical protein
MTEILERLHTGRGLAWADLIPAFDLAIIQAEQAEYEADRAMNLAQCGASPAYPPLVLKLAESVPEPPKPEPFVWPDLEAPKAPWEEATK